MAYEFKYFRAGRMNQLSLTCGADIAALAEADRKLWTAISMPVKGVRFDARTLELLDTDHDGRIRTPEVLAAIDFLKAKNVDFDELFVKSETDEKALASVLERQADLAKIPPSDADKAALADWEAKGKTPEVAVLGENTAAAESALAAVEPIIDAYFTPPADMPLVTEAADVELPLKDHLNPKHLEAILDFAAKCVTPILGEQEKLSRLGWKKVKGAFAAYRAWVGAKPVMNAGAMGELVEEERLYRYKLNLLEFLENYTNMKRLYDLEQQAIFQTGVLRIDAREMNLCFHVDSEGAHSALADKSKCCVIYLKLTRPAEKAERTICAVVTAGTVGTLYAGRNGVFYDRDGKDWEAVVTKVVEAQVSLMEAFWAPWKKLGDGISSLVKKFLGDKQSSVMSSAEAGKLPAAPKEGNGGGGAAMASSVAAIGIGIGMVGAAFASIMAAVTNMGATQLLLSIVAIIAVVSLPSVILTWFKLRQRDIGAILNASGWAVNRPLHFSMKRAAAFTVCPAVPAWIKPAVAVLLWGAFLALLLCGCTCSQCWKCGDPDDPVVGNWGLQLHYGKDDSGHMIASRDANGNAQALVLWQWGSPEPMKDVKFEGNRFSFIHPRGNKRVEGTVECGKLVATVFKADGSVDTPVEGWRNPPVEEANTADAKLGEPVDLLKDGLAGWEQLEQKGKFGWSFKDGVLSNKLGVKDDGSWVGGGVNLRTKRADFYDFNLEYDVRVPKNSNSGVYLRGRYECQVVDSFGKPVDMHNMAAYYGRVTPSVAAEKPAGEWQHVNVTLYKRHLTVVLNGQKIIDNAPVVGITGGAVDAHEFVPGFIYLQGDHSDADYKNMILRPCVD